jgi:hypothetical protein
LNFGDQNGKTGKKITAPVDLRVFFITILILNTLWILLGHPLFTNPQSRQLVSAHSTFRGRALNTPALYNIILTVPEP